MIAFATTATNWAVATNEIPGDTYYEEHNVPFGASFRDKVTREFVVSSTSAHNEAVVSSNNSKPDSSLPNTVTDFLAVDYFRHK